MATIKTRPTDVPVLEFLAAVEPARRRDEGLEVHAIMTDVTGDPGSMWGPSIVGYGSMEYRTRDGAVNDWPPVGFSPRKAQLTFYGLQDSPDAPPLLERLGPHSLSVGCVYVKRLEALDEPTLRELIALAFARNGEKA